MRIKTLFKKAVGKALFRDLLMGSRALVAAGFATTFIESDIGINALVGVVMMTVGAVLVVVCHGLINTCTDNETHKEDDDTS